MLVILFEMAFLIVGCIQNRTVELKKDVKEGRESKHLSHIDSAYPEIKDTIRLSQIADSLFYVPLQSTDPYKMDGVKKLQLADSFIFIQTPGSDLFMFTMKGKFIRKINDGLTTCFGFDVLEKEQLIFVMSNKKIAIYDYEGRIKKQIRIKQDWEGIGYCIAGIDSSSVAISLWNNGIRTARLMILNTDGKIVKEFPNPETFQSPHLSVRNASAFQRSLFHYQDGIRYHPYYCDTLFALTDTLLKPVFIEKKIFKVPLEHRLEYVGDEETFTSYCVKQQAYATRFFESDRYIFIDYRLGYLEPILPNYLLYDKSTDSLFNYKQELVFKNKSLHFGLYNDYDGGLPFSPAFMSGEYFIQSFSAYYFKEAYTKGRNLDNGHGTEHYEIKSNYPARKERKKPLDDLVKRLNPEDNPVLMIVKLKSLSK